MQHSTFRGGVHPRGMKELSRDKRIQYHIPKGDLVFPLSQHIGKPAIPVVKKNDPVLAGQIIAKADGFVSANIISSCSGKVKAIEARMTSAGVMAQCIVIENAPLGVQSGHAAGCFTIGVTTGPIPEKDLYKAGADMVYPSMEALAQALPSLIEAFKQTQA